MQPVRIRIRQDADLSVSQAFESVRSRINADGRSNIVNRLGGQYGTGLHLPGIQYFSSKWHYRLDQPITGLSGRPPGGIPFYEIQFAHSGILFSTIRQFSRQGRRGQGVIALPIGKDTGAAVAGAVVNLSNRVILISKKKNSKTMFARALSKVARTHKGKPAMAIRDKDAIANVIVLET